MMIEMDWRPQPAIRSWFGVAPHGSVGMVWAQDEAGAGAAMPRPGRVLIVEDEFFVALDIEHALGAAGFTVVGLAATAEEAVELAETSKPELVLMDIHLAGKRDGIDAAAEIRRRFGIPCVFATAHSDASTKTRGEALAAPFGWLSKPYRHNELVAAVRDAVARARREPGGGN